MKFRVLFSSWIIIIILLSSRCIYQVGGASIYEATALTKEGNELIKKYQIKYLCPDVYGLYYADIIRSKGVFAFDIHETKDSKIQYKIVDQKLVSQLGLMPKFSWWDNNGKFVALLIVIVIVILWLVALGHGILITPGDD